MVLRECSAGLCGVESVQQDYVVLRKCSVGLLTHKDGEDCVRSTRPLVHISGLRDSGRVASKQKIECLLC